YITDAGLISEPFKVKKGVRQGDPLSSLFYQFPSDWFKFTEITKIYEAASNARVNKSKLVLIPITTTAQEYNFPSERKFKKLAIDDPISILGYKVDSGGNPMKHL
ncbi:4891_t:CDS:2, partial [Gigaspora rosea]